MWVSDLEDGAKRDPDLARILEGTHSNPKVIRAKIKESLGTKLDHVLGESPGSLPKVTFRQLEDMSNLWVWLEFKAHPSNLDRDNLQEAIKAFFIVGKLGGYNSLNLQMFFAGDADPSFFQYNDTEAEQKIPACFHELGEIEFRGKWARFFLDIGTADELSIDVLLNMLLGFSKDFFPITKILMGGDNADWTRPPRQSRMELLWNQIRESRIIDKELTEKPDLL